MYRPNSSQNDPASFTDDACTPRPPPPKRFKTDSINAIADQLVAPKTILQYQYPGLTAPQQNYNYRNPNLNLQQGAPSLPLRFNPNTPVYTATSQIKMDKRHPSSFQQLEKVIESRSTVPFHSFWSN